MFPDGKEWFRGTTLHGDVGSVDIAVARLLYGIYEDTVLPFPAINVTLNLDTDQVRGFLFKASASLVWPKVIDGGGQPDDADPVVSRFPLTQVGNHSFKDFVVTNPSDHPVYFHLVPLAVYPDGLRFAHSFHTW